MKRKINIIIINGRPRSGKDTVIDLMRKYCLMNECARFRAYSTIDPVKDVLKKLGWNGEKTDEVRNILASLKQFWINNNNGPLKYCIDIIVGRMTSNDTDDDVLVFQIREPNEIKKLINVLEPIKSVYGLNVSTLFVHRFSANGEAYGNSADANVADYEYSDEIFNTGTLEQLERNVYEYMNELLEVR